MGSASAPRRAPRGLALLVLALGVLSVAPAPASKPRCRLERIDLASLDATGALRVTGGVVELEGQVDTDRPAGQYRLLINGKTAAKAEKLEAFERSGQDLYLVLAVEVSALYAPAIEKIKETLHEFLESLPPKTKAKLILFGWEIDSQPPGPVFLPVAALSQGIDDLNPQDEGEVQLLNAINTGLVALNKVQPGKDKSGKPVAPRKVIVVLSDGLNQLMDRKSFKRTGDLLKQNNVSLFPVAFSPRDDRGPLLNLGELAKRSAGTFRWAQKDENLKDQFLALADELKRTHVLTFPGKKLDAETLLTSAVSLGCGDIKSAVYSFPGGPPIKHSTWWKWLLGIVGSLVGLWVLASGALWALKRRAGAQPGASLPPGALPPGMGTLPMTTLPAGALAPLPPGALPPGSLPVGYAPPGSLPVGYVPPGSLPVGYAPPGYPLPTGGYPQAPAMPAAPGAVPGRVLTATLIGIGAGALGGQRFKVEATLIVGRGVSGPDTLAVSDDPSVGPSHCEIRRDAAGFVLTDFGTPGGTQVNDQRVAGHARLTDGDLLRIGEATQFKFRIDD